MNIVNNLICIAPVALLTACSTPGDFVRDKAPITYASKQGPFDAAECIARNADEYSIGQLNGSVRNIRKDPVEVVVRAGSNAYATAQVWQIADGSRIELFLGTLASITPETIGTMLTKNCL